MAKNADARPHLAIPSVLGSFKRSVEANTAVANAEQLRNTVDTVAALADCDANRKKLAEAGYAETLFAPWRRCGINNSGDCARASSA